MKFRKKPVVIEAFRLGLDNIPDWFMDRVTSNDIALHGERKDLRSADIKTLEGVMRGEKGDYIIRGVKGEIYPCKADIFSATYEPVGDFSSTCEQEKEIKSLKQRVAKLGEASYFTPGESKF